MLFTLKVILDQVSLKTRFQIIFQLSTKVELTNNNDKNFFPKITVFLIYRDLGIKGDLRLKLLVIKVPVNVSEYGH